MVVRKLVNLIVYKTDKSSVRRADDTNAAFISGIEKRAQRATIFITGVITAGLGMMAKVASEAKEIDNKFRQTFQQNAKGMEERLRAIVGQLDRSVVGAKESTSAFQAFFTGLKFSSDEAARMSEMLYKLQLDFSSFHDVSTEESGRIFMSGLAGQGEVFIRRGIDIMEHALGAKMKEMGLADSLLKASAQEKVLGRIAILSEAMGRQGSVGDAVRTMGDFANRLRAALETSRDLIVSWGTRLLPIGEKLLTMYIKTARTLNEKMNPELKSVVLGFAAVAAVIPPVILGFMAFLKIGSIMGGFFSILTKAGSIKGIGLIGHLIMLAGKATLVTGAILLVIGAVEDLWFWINNKPSLTGDLLGDYANYKPSIDKFVNGFKAMFKSAWKDGGVEKLVAGILGMSFGAFTMDKKLIADSWGVFKDGVVEASEAITNQLNVALKETNRLLLLAADSKFFNKAGEKIGGFLSWLGRGVGKVGSYLRGPERQEGPPKPLSIKDVYESVLNPLRSLRNASSSFGDSADATFNKYLYKPGTSFGTGLLEGISPSFEQMMRRSITGDKNYVNPAVKKVETTVNFNGPLVAENPEALQEKVRNAVRTEIKQSMDEALSGEGVNQ